MITSSIFRLLATNLYALALFFVVAAYLFKPSDVGQALTYELAWSQHFDGDTIGGMSLADINNDGFIEFVLYN